MLRVRWRVLAPLLAFLVVAVLRASAHEERDPVCGMMVPVDEAKWTALHGGGTYYFCSAQDLALFRANPDQFTGGLRLNQSSGGTDWSLYVETPAERPTRCTIRASRNGVSVDVRAVTAIVYALDRTQPPAPRRFRVHEVSPTEAAFQFWPAGVTDVRVALELPQALAGETPYFSFSIEPPVAIVNDETSDDDPRPYEPISMARQHRSMRIVGTEWDRITNGLIDPGVSLPDLARAAWKIQRELALTPGFSLHKFARDENEFVALADGTSTRVHALGRSFLRNDREQARRTRDEIEAWGCAYCHLKFRFGVVPSLAGFPLDLEER